MSFDTGDRSEGPCEVTKEVAVEISEESSDKPTTGEEPIFEETTSGAS